MSKPLTRKTTDHSDEKGFAFSFFCDICGKEWKSPAALFETSGMTIEHKEARELLWRQERSNAFETANLEAHMRFNNCPVCGKWVCDDCFNPDGMRCGECGE